MALPKDVKFVTFDCYGTLIDWETGVYEAFQNEADRDGFTIDRDVLIPRFIDVQRDSVGLPHPARDDEDVRVDRDGSQSAFNSLPASRKVLTSASGFLRPSSSSPCRFTQITGTLDLRQGSTSVG